MTKIKIDDKDQKDCNLIVKAYYDQYDQLFSNISTIEDQWQLSPDGHSILQDIEFYLGHPKHKSKAETIFKEQLKLIATSILQEG